MVRPRPPMESQTRCTVFCVQDTEDLLPAFQLLHQMFLGYPPCQLYLCPFEKIILSFYIRT